MTPRAVFSSRLGKGEAASYKLFIRGVGGREIERVIDTPNISVVREDTLKGIKVEMELGSGKMEDHLFLFNVS